MLLSPRDMSNYAFLGVKFIPNNDNRVNITVNVGEDEDELLNDNIAMKSDRVFVGIPCEYAEAVLNTAKMLLKKHCSFRVVILSFILVLMENQDQANSHFQK